MPSCTSYKNHINGGSIIPHINDQITAITITSNFTNSATHGYTIPIDPGDLYSAINKLLKQANYGLRTIRPEVAAYGLTIELYKESSSPAVRFTSAQGHIKVKTYLESMKGSKNVGYIRTQNGSATYWANGVVSEPLGIARRDLLIDASDITTAAGPALNEQMLHRTKTELGNHTATKTFDFELTDLNPYSYNDDYYLGSIITVDADYGYSQDMSVAEFIRAEDEEGYREYPTLVSYVPPEFD